MARNRKPIDPDPFGEEVVKAWARTTHEQRRKVLQECQSYTETISYLFFLETDALRLACFLEFGHPSVCKPNGRPLKKNYGELRDLMLAWLVDNPQESVDNLSVSVDKSVDNSVDKNATYPQETDFQQAFVDNSMKLSTYPQFIHRCLVDKLY